MNGQAKQARRNAVVRLLSPMRKHNYFKGFNAGNSHVHEFKKLEVALRHQAAGHEVILEAEFVGGGRCDVLCLDCKTAFEVMSSETEESIRGKARRYPAEIMIVEVKA